MKPQPREFLGELDTRLVDEFAGIDKVLHPFGYWSQRMQALIVIPAGFLTDWASVPRLPLMFLMLGGKGKKAALFHDGLYSGILAIPCGSMDLAEEMWLRMIGGEVIEGTLLASRDMADQVFGEALSVSGYSNAVVGAMYLGVRIGGESRFNAPNVPQPPHVAALMEAP